MTRLPTVIARRLAISLLMSCLPAAGALAADDENANDARCVVVAFGLSQSPDPRVRARATGASLYFVGRIRGRSP